MPPRVTSYGRGGSVAGIGLESVGTGVTRAPGGDPRPWEAFGTGGSDGRGTACMLATSGRQEAGFLVYVGGVQVPFSQLLSVEVTRAIDQPRQTWAFALALNSPDGHFGNPLVYLAPGIGTRAVDIFGAYRTDDGQIVRYPLISNGLVDSSVRGLAQDGRRETFSGFDVAARRGRQPVTLVVPAGSNLQRREVVERIYSLAGEGSFSLRASGLINKEVQLIDADPLSVVQEVLAAENRLPSWDAFGFLRDPQMAPYAGQPLNFQILEAHILKSTEVDLTSPGDVITSITLTSTKQVTKAENVACAREVKTTEVVTFSLFAPRSSLKVQTSDCSVPASGESQGAATYIPVQRVVSTTETVCGTLVAESTQTYGYRRTEAARYQWSAALHAFACRPGVYLDGDATPGGNETAYAERRERWVLASSTTTHHYYDRPGFTGPQGATSDPWFGAFAGTATNSDNPGTGYKLGSIVESRAWYFRQAAAKAQTSPASPWESIEPRPDGLFTGNHYGVATDRDEFLTIERLVTVLRPAGGGYLAGFTNYTYRWGIRPGSEFQYRGTDTSGDAEEVFLLTSDQATTYVPIGEGAHQVFFVNFDHLQGGVTGSSVTTMPGAPPAIERAQDATDTAPITETQTIKAQVEAPGLLAEHLPREVKTSVAYAESEDELSLLGELKILESAAQQLEFETRGAFFAVRDGDWGRVRIRALGLDGPVLIKQVRHWRDEQSPAAVHSSFAALIFPSF